MKGTHAKTPRRKGEVASAGGIEVWTETGLVYTSTVYT